MSDSRIVGGLQVTETRYMGFSMIGLENGLVVDDSRGYSHPCYSPTLRTERSVGDLASGSMLRAGVVQLVPIRQTGKRGLLSQ